VNPASINCIARDASGRVIPNAITIPTLNALGHWADFQFPALSGLRGTFDCASTAKIGTVALRFLGTNSLSTLPILLK
jgi:hypothetical protein